MDQPIEPMTDMELSHLRQGLAMDFMDMPRGRYPMKREEGYRLLATIDALKAERDAALARHAALMAEILAIIADDVKCCGNPTPRDIYSYDEHGNAVDIIGQEPGDDCCGCPVQRHPATILAAVRAALPDIPIPTSEEG